MKVTLLRSLAVAMIAGGVLVVGSSSSAKASAAGPSSLASSAVTVYGAKWCNACKALEAGLRDRKIAFDLVDVDDNGAAFAKARAESGSGGSIPLTGIIRPSNTVWIVGADIDAVDKAQRGE